jgi:uncharacterized protein with GYD domain
METYIALINYTDKGIALVADAAERTDIGRATLKSLGGEMKQSYMVMGPYDFVVIYEVPSAEAAATFALTMCKMGYVRMTTMKAFDSQATHDIIAGLS